MQDKPSAPNSPEQTSGRNRTLRFIVTVITDAEPQTVLDEIQSNLDSLEYIQTAVVVVAAQGDI